MINDMVSNKGLSPIVIELFIRGRKLSLSLVFFFFMLLYFAVTKNIRLNSKNYFLVKIPNKRELQQIAFNHSSDIDIYQKCAAKPYSVLAIDTILAADNSSLFIKDQRERI